ncbi:transcription factor bHLH121 isoform X2 [Cryptomeria japonica]|uniref:transcription factor bHLH121 isoform X2 n=1 Tax=Cryptomeria japonica TaxID=3369 RepID=UPI0027DA751E|nr:transcription factor bHLH121 isoform X2 [Cryptomeria japonica]
MSANSGDAYVSFCQPLGENILADFSVIPELENAPIQDFDTHGDNRPAKKSHKADREKLRREKINEQFADLAAALDPDRPKNDKASILIESTQVVKELRAELKRLQQEHSSLLNESRELTEEKNEIREEKINLKNETEKLQDQLQRQLRSLSPWMMMDPAVMMTAPSFPYAVPVPQAATVPSSNCQQPFASSQAQGPLVAPSAYVPLATVGTFPVHPVLHAYAFPTYGPSLNGHSHVERPYAQYPSQVHPIPPYLAQMQPHQDSQPTVSSSGPAICQPLTSAALSSPLQNITQPTIVNSLNLQTEEVGKHAISSSDIAVAEHRESSVSAVSRSSKSLPKDANKELLSSPSTSSTEVHCGSNALVSGLEGEDKLSIELGSTEQVHEVTSEQGAQEAEVDKPKQDRVDDALSSPAV